MLLEKIPDEIVDIILAFFVHKIDDLILFRTFSSQCKRIGDRSSLWLSKELSFYVPLDYFMIYRYDLRTEKVSKKNFSDFHILLIDPAKLESSSSFQEDYGFSKLVSKGSYPKITIIPYSNCFVSNSSQDLLASDNISPLSHNLSRLGRTEKERVEKTRLAFLFYLRKFNQMWGEYIDYYQHENRIKKIISPITERAQYIKLCGIFLLVSTYFPLTDEINPKSGWSTAQNISFLVWYVHVLCAFAIFVLLGWLEIYKRILHKDKFELKSHVSFPWYYGTPYFVPACLYLGTGLSILLFQIKFSNFTSPQLTWTTATYPMCLFYSTSFIAIYYYEYPWSYKIEEKFFFKLFIRGILLLLLPLFFLLLGLYCDERLASTDAYTLTAFQVVLPLCPICFLCFTLLISCTKETLSMLSNTQPRQWPEMFTLLLPKIIRSVGLTSLIRTMIVYLLEERLTLEKGIQSILLISICFHILILFE